jgi:molybdopterin synthase catalytic subunit
LAGSLLFSVNREYAPSDKRLSADDEVALIPPVSGGADV